jgi:prolyl 4-hydroxylase
MNILVNYWNKNKQKREPEEWGMGKTQINNWVSSTSMVSVDNSQYHGSGTSLRKKISDATRPILEEWSGMELTATSIYGIREYTDGAILSPHVDRHPLVISCIINVDQDVDEPWVLEIYDRHDRAVNITMEPGDMVLYESGSLIHGRPFPLKGRF